jgi:Lon protease-like protein
MAKLPLFPLNTVLFPGGRLPLRLFEQRYLEMAKACLRDGSPFGVCLIREGAEVGAPATPADVGCLATIATWDMPQLGMLNIVALGTQRFRIVERSAQKDGLVLGTVQTLPEDADAAVAQDHLPCVKLLERVIEQRPAMFEPPHRLDSASWVGARLAEILPLPLGAKQELLELADGGARLARIHSMLAG